MALTSTRTDPPDWQSFASQAYSIYAVLCAGFLASQFYRVSNAVIAPELMRELTIQPEDMGFVTGVFFLVFAAAQLPVGVVLDRFAAVKQEMEGGSSSRAAQQSKGSTKYCFGVALRQRLRKHHAKVAKQVRDATS